MRGSTGVVALTWLVLAGACVLPASAAFPGANGRIVFASNRRADLQLQVFAVPAEGGLPRNVSRRPAYINTDASVGPGGTIVFASAPAGDFGAPGVWAVGPGGKRRRLASGLAPSVSPDGALVAYTSPHADGLLVVSAHGGRARTLSDTSAAAVWSPDGRWLAAAGNGVLLLRADGVETRRLAEGLNANFSLPSWSPDGRGIVVSDGVLHVVEVATGQETPLKEGTDPVWSPKGDLIAFVRAGQIATIRPDGSRMRDVTAPPAGDADMRPAWAPDGIRLAFVRKRPAADVTEASQLGVVNVVSGELRALTPADGRIVDPFVRGLSWSADGRKIYYSSRSTRDVFHLFTVGSNLHGVRQLTRGPENDRQPVWAADGRRVAFVRDGDSLVVLDRNRARVVARAPDLSSPTWSPDGRLAYAAGAAIWVVDPERPGVRGLVAGSEPAWSPAGGWIAYVHDGIRLVRPDGTGDHSLRADEQDLVFKSPTWSPRGDVLYFLRRERCPEDYLWCGTGGTVVAMRPFTQPASEVRLPLFSGDKPAVSPDGRFFVFGGGTGLARAPISGSGTSFSELSYATETEPDWQRLKVPPRRRSGRAGSR